MTPIVMDCSRDLLSGLNKMNGVRLNHGENIWEIMNIFWNSDGGREDGFRVT